MADVKILDPATMRTPELDALVTDFIDDIRFASGKAMAHLADPRAFPLPADTGSVERILVAAAQASGEAEQLAHLKSAGARFAADPIATIGRRRADEFNAVDLRSSTAVLDQLAARRQSSQPDAPGLRVLSGTVAGMVLEPHSTLTWHLNHVKCVVETGATAIGSDHLYIGGTTIDAFGNTVSGGVHDLTGGWDTGNAQSFDTALAVNNLSLGAGWPRTYYYVCAISVRGTDKLYEFLDKVVTYARDYAVKYIGAAAGAWAGLQAGALVGSLGGPLGAAVGAVVGAIVGYLVGAALAKLWEEISGYFKGSTKLFGSITIQVDIPKQGFLFPGGSNTTPFTLTWKGFDGEYRLKLDARVAWIPTFEPAAISRVPDHLELVCTEGDYALRMRRWPENSGWSYWEPMATLTISPDSPIAVVAPTPTQLDVVTIVLDGRVLDERRGWKNGQPTAWTGDFLPDPPAGLIPGTVVSAVSRGAGLIDVFATAKDGKVYTAATGPQTGGKWAGWWPVGQGTFLPGTPISAVSRSEGRIDLFAIGLDARVWSAAYGPTSADKWGWVGWFSILEETFVPGAHVGAISRKTDQIDLFATNLNSEVRTAAWSPAGNAGKWGGWWRITDSNGTFAPGTPISVVNRSPEHLDVFAIGLDGSVWAAAWGEQTSYKWAGWWRVGQAVFAKGSRIAATARSLNRQDLFVRGFDGNVWSQAWDGAWKEFVV